MRADPTAAPGTVVPKVAPFTWAGVLHGARLTLPVWPALTVFGAAFGAAAAQRGLRLGETLGLSGFVYAGAAQLVSLELWQEVWTPATLLAVVTVTALINARMILMGASVQPWLRGSPIPRTALTLFFFVDQAWLIAVRYRGEGGRDLGVLMGAGMGMWPLWMAATLLGYLGGGLVTDPHRLGFDLMMPVFFSAMLVPLWRGWRPALPWFASGIVALVAQHLLPGYAFILAGALAGLVTGALVPDGALPVPEPSPSVRPDRTADPSR